MALLVQEQERQAELNRQKEEELQRQKEIQEARRPAIEENGVDFKRVTEKKQSVAKKPVGMPPAIATGADKSGSTMFLFVRHPD